ncbi:hypothetical protein TPHA_0F01720 [Tetrapisispora phaffii CBS 4417]|uniref:BZIP domain-containing protein n=1 Tax=Tetrapisispora phaffii (strain ATCC 24235 / CBS 4417 / NBRC 1672 / NRRL Y-8282 / UCD 70-5) TaxID=1071381 RepID=G8BV74_TETPH|nr:hypothetical protein TPHA_0F01720 [Tetrapisispora phaffii CBS 4417]CCE63656.1 hypothetical protein TPHA_0F01720 [Tetrapisispora phaffii CBS 4417]
MFNHNPNGSQGGKNIDKSKSYNTDFMNIFGDDGNGSSSINDVYHHPNAMTTTNANSNESENTIFESDNTASILLEQLAYVDNFMASSENDFVDINSLVAMENGFYNHQVVNEGINSAQGLPNQNLDQDNIWGLDERLARELSVFADSSFIFHDEDKPKQDGDENDNSNNNSNSNNNIADDTVLNNRDDITNQEYQRKPHYLTQRKNDILKSQYDHSKSRFSSKKKKTPINAPASSAVDSVDFVHINRNDIEETFSNFDIIASDSVAQNSQSNHVTTMGNNNNTVIINNDDDDNDDDDNNNSSNNDNDNDNDDNNNSNNSNNNDTQGRGTTVDNKNTASLQIEQPDLASMPTSTLISFFPRLKVPTGVINSLTQRGLTMEQIDALSVIIAYHQQEKKKNPQNGETVTQIIDSQNINADYLVTLLSDSRLQHSNIASSSKSYTDSDSNSNPKDIMKSNFVNVLFDLVKNNVLSNESKEDTLPHNEDSISTNLPESRLKKVNISENIIDTTPTQVGQHKELKREIPESDVQGEKTLNIKRVKMENNIKYTIPTTPTMKAHQKRKKKEQELESSVNKLSELAISLQQKIHALEMENKLLKQMVYSNGKISTESDAENLKKFILENKSPKKDNK